MYISATYVSEENMIEVIVDLLLLKLGTGSRDCGPGWEGRRNSRRQESAVLGAGLWEEQ